MLLNIRTVFNSHSTDEITTVIISKTERSVELQTWSNGIMNMQEAIKLLVERVKNSSRSYGNLYAALLGFLSPEERWDHHLFWIKCAYAAGMRDEMNALLDEYMEAKRYDQISNNSSTTNLIWRCEVLGRFDCAEILDKTVSDNLGVDYLSEPGNMANKGKSAEKISCQQTSCGH